MNLSYKYISLSITSTYNGNVTFHGPPILTEIRLINIRMRVWISYCIMTMSSNGNIFRVTGPLCGEFTGHRFIPRTKASVAELWYFLWSALDKRLCKQSWVCDLRRYRAHYDVTVMMDCFWSDFSLRKRYHLLQNLEQCGQVCPLWYWKQNWLLRPVPQEGHPWPSVQIRSDVQWLPVVLQHLRAAKAWCSYPRAAGRDWYRHCH